MYYFANLEKSHFFGDTSGIGTIKCSLFLGMISLPRLIWVRRIRLNNWLEVMLNIILGDLY